MANLPPAAEPAEHAQQLTVYISEQDHWRKQPLYLAICDLLRRQGGAGATVLKGRRASARRVAARSIPASLWTSRQICPWSSSQSTPRSASRRRCPRCAR